jgi:hypothetical protein
MNEDGEVIEGPSQAAIDAFFAEVGTRAATDPLPAPRSHQQYGADCLAAGVPLPPAFDSGLWVSKGNLGPDGHFTSEPVVDILAYESTSPGGVCVALPRKAATATDIQLVGVICQSDGGKGCFWDNVPDDTPADQPGGRFVKPTIAEFDISKFRNGDQLFEDCTNCHRGDNVFLIHGTELESVPRRKSAQRYHPIPEGTKASYVRAEERVWSNPARTRPGNDDNLMRPDGCGDGACHQLPALGWKYCTDVLKPAITRGLMPPSGGLDATRRETSFCRDFCLLLRECVLLSPQTKSGKDVWALFDPAPTDCSCDVRWQSVWPIAEATPD